MVTDFSTDSADACSRVIAKHDCVPRCRASHFFQMGIIDRKHSDCYFAEQQCKSVNPRTPLCVAMNICNFIQSCCAGDDDSDADESAAAHPAPASAHVEQPQSASSAAISNLAAVVKAPTTPSLRTRLIAARLVLELPAAVGSDSRHFDALAAQAVRCLPVT